MRKILAIMFVMMVFVGCGNRHTADALYNQHGEKKTQISVVPVIIKQQINLPWNVSEELTDKVCVFMKKSPQFYLETSEVSTQDLPKNITLSENPISYLPDGDNADYVVVMELLNHGEVKYCGQKVVPLYPRHGETGSIIMMKMRVKVWDMRGEAPKVVLQEIVSSNHMVIKKESFLDYNRIPWGTAAYRVSPIGLAHTRLARDVAKHLQTYISYSEK